jgi:hypothetical protein
MVSSIHETRENNFLQNTRNEMILFAFREIIDENWYIIYMEIFENLIIIKILIMSLDQLNIYRLLRYRSQ